MRQFTLKLSVWVLVWHVVYYAWFIITSEIHSLLTPGT